MSTNLNLVALQQSLSKERFDSYRETSDLDELDALTRYAWNLALCASFYPLLNVFEITLRNRLFQIVSSKYPAAPRQNNGIACWLDYTRPILTDREVRSVNKAKARIPKPRKGRVRSVSPGRLVAELTLDFWVYLFHEPYQSGHSGAEANLWPKMIKSVFPSMDPHRRQMALIVADLEEIREFRNRIFHHEPIWRDDLRSEMARIISLTYAMQRDAGKLLTATERVTKVLDLGIAPWRAEIVAAAQV